MFEEDRAQQQIQLNQRSGNQQESINIFSQYDHQQQLMPLYRVFKEFLEQIQSQIIICRQIFTRLNYNIDKMPFFQNSRFLVSLIKSQGLQDNFQSKELPLLLITVESEVKVLIETAIKCMRKDKRERLESIDIQFATNIIGHSDLAVSPLPRSLIGGNTVIPIEKLVDVCAHNLQNHIEQMKLKANWIYRKDQKVKETLLKSIRKVGKAEIVRSIRNPMRGQFNRVIFREQEAVTIQEVQYLHKFEVVLVKNQHKLIRNIDGNVRKLFLGYLALISQYNNEAGIVLLTKLVNHPQIDRNIILCYIHKILEILLTYRGTWAYKVGLLIVDIVGAFIDTQPSLIGVMEKYQVEYSHIIKSIAFQEAFHVCDLRYNWQLVIKMLINNCYSNRQMAGICLREIMKKSHLMQAFSSQGHNIPYWIPSQWFANDRYLGY